MALKRWLAAVAAAGAVWVSAADALACGGFFCSRTPVDQSSERILFAVGPSSTTMVVQVAYSGGDSDFSWVLPLGAVPVAGSLEVFPQMALASLDANTGPVFNMPQDCWRYWALDAAAGAPTSECGGGNCGSPTMNGVVVHVNEEVGPYGVVVVESQDPAALTGWLVENGYRVTPAMEPYVAQYTQEGMKFMALKLLPGATVNQIQPLKFTLPGTSPSVPIRLSALAAEPEMGILVMVLGDTRYQPANWPLVDIADDEITYDPANVWGANGTNWAALVARKIDEAGGQGFVTEMAGTTAPMLEMVQNSNVNTPEQEEARRALLDVMNGQRYFTRLYARLSPEEMRTDPIFRRSLLGDVSRTHELSRYVNGVDMCGDTEPAPPDACAFAACGAGGRCAVDETGAAGCACLDMATARAVSTPGGRPSVSCQDTRMSFVKPGDLDQAGQPLPDPCLTASCGEHGRCTAVNMTTTCQCDRGFVAVATPMGLRCNAPASPIPPEFYLRQLPDPARPGAQSPGDPPVKQAALGCTCATPEDRATGLASLFLAALLVQRARRRA